jgi:hypothetical protein
LGTLKHSGVAKTYKLIGRILILDQIDTALIPLELAIGKTTRIRRFKKMARIIF